MSSKLTQEELSDVMLQSVALSAILCEKFEVMSENGLVMHKTKQSLKTTFNFLNAYLSKVFDVKGQDEDTVNHMKQGASHVSELSNRVETALKAENLLSISERKKILYEIIEGLPLFDNFKEKLYQEIRDSGIIDY